MHNKNSLSGKFNILFRKLTPNIYEWNVQRVFFAAFFPSLKDIKELIKFAIEAETSKLQQDKTFY